MTITLDHHGQRYSARLEHAYSLAIPLQFDGPQPNHFGASRASRVPLRMGEFVGQTELGGSCNVDSLTLVPHCNGTHTETISHIVNDDIWIGHAATAVLVVAVLVTVPVTDAANTREGYRPELDGIDQVVTAASLKAAVKQHAVQQPGALIVRTLPNAATKVARSYTSQSAPAFFTTDAMAFINAMSIRHLLVDLPSIDRMYDEGLLTNQHLFWNVPERGHSLTSDSWQDKTITEMIFAEDHIRDGVYLLNLQVPAFGSDAAPSRPVVLPVSAIDDISSSER